MATIAAVSAHYRATRATPPLSQLPLNSRRQSRFSGCRRRVFSTSVAMPIAICAAEKKEEEFPFLKLVVGAATELLRIISRKDSSDFVSDSATPNDVSVADVDDLIAVLEYDYKRSYFLTGKFTTSIYAEDCWFLDPTIKFNGRDLYQRNLQLLVPFFENPSLSLSSIDQGLKGETRFIEAKWQLRTNLKFPWRPLISLEGSTIYNLDDNLKIINHVESWSITPFEAIAQIFVPSSNLF